MISIVKKHWPLIIALVIFWIIVTVLLVSAFSQNREHVTYTLDDPYIHMAIAKHLAQNGVWGVTKYEFSSSSSSSLWTLLLALIYSLFGVNDVAPYVLNCIFGIGLILAIYFILRKYTLRPGFIFIVLLLIIFSAPLAPLVFTGLEPILQMILTILFVYFSAEVISNEPSTNMVQGEQNSGKKYIILLILAFLVTFIRYEGIFLVMASGILFLLRKRWLQFLWVSVAGILPIMLYGIVSLSKGWYFFPNSIILKGYLPNITESHNLFKIPEEIGCRLLQNPYMIFLLLISLLVSFIQLNKEGKVWKSVNIMNLIFIITAILHVKFANFGWFFRYEAYLVVLGIFVIAVGIIEHLPEKMVFNDSKNPVLKYLLIILFIGIIIFPFYTRARDSLKVTSQATTNIFQQQYQMGLFLKKFYQDKAVAANDVGAINYLADIRCVDLYGIGTLEVAMMQAMGKYNSFNLDKLVKNRNVSIAIVYDDWLIRSGGIPPDWTKCGEWTIPNNAVCANSTVSFYAIAPAEKINLIKNLQSFSRELPMDVRQSGKYTE